MRHFVETSKGEVVFDLPEETGSCSRVTVFYGGGKKHFDSLFRDYSVYAENGWLYLGNPQDDYYGTPEYRIHADTEGRFSHLERDS